MLDSIFLNEINTEFYTIYTVHEKNNYLVGKINSCLDRHLPLTLMKDKLHMYPKEIRSLITWKKFLWKAQKSEPLKYKNKYQEVNRLVRKEIYTYNLLREEKLASNSKNFARYIKNNTNPNIPISDLIFNDAIVSDNKEKAEIFSDLFNDYFSNYSSEIPPFEARKFKTTLEDINLTVQMVNKILCRSDLKANTSPDGISFNVLKKCRFSLSPWLTELFRISLTSGEIPECWKECIIKPIPKCRSPKTFSDFRPIALGCSISKIMEKLIANEIIKHMTSNKLFHTSQFGFLPKSSTTNQLITQFEDIYEAIYNKENVDLIYIDIAKAFDSVVHSLLLVKIWQYGIKGKVFAWLKEFLSKRKFRVKIGEHFSGYKNISSGVPQGSPLGPLLFIIFINDLPSCIPPNLDIKIKMYADDLKVYKTYKNDNANSGNRYLQLALNEISKWVANWSLQINENKTKIFSIKANINSQKSTYKLNNRILEETETIRDLGLVMDNKLTFLFYINKIVKTGFFKVRQLFRVLKSRSLSLWPKVYKTYVRPHLEYCSQIWNPMYKEHIQKIERVQKYFTRRVFKKCGLTYVNYHERLKILKLDQLEFRREVTDMLTIQKICHIKTNIMPGEIFKFSSRPQQRHNYQVLIKHRNSKTKNSFFNRVSNKWNNLSAELANTVSPIMFKMKYVNYLKNLKEIDA